jgi:hypothetical protein
MWVRQLLSGPIQQGQIASRGKLYSIVALSQPPLLSLVSCSAKVVATCHLPHLATGHCKCSTSPASPALPFRLDLSATFACTFRFRMGGHVSRGTGAYFRVRSSGKPPPPHRLGLCRAAEMELDGGMHMHACREQQRSGCRGADAEKRWCENKCPHAAYGVAGIELCPLPNLTPLHRSVQ